VPELPEVETVRSQLSAGLEGMTFTAVEQVEPFMLRDCDADALVAGLPGRRIERVDRLGKFIIIKLGDGAGSAGDAVPAPVGLTASDGGAELFLTLHLGMTGQLLVDPEANGAHTRFRFRLSDDRGHEALLEFRDMRKFGRLHLTVGGPAPRLARLGPDAWKGDWDAAYLAGRLRGRSAPVKAFLLDQRHLAGIGNIYADEILWWTALSPLREAGSLAEEQVCCLADEIRTRLGEGVRLLGCSLSDFVDTEGREGGFQEWLQAYGRQGLDCHRCGGTMTRIVIGGRGTAYCPDCQR
jgi:formamidopyrimidine-DNA glycosylase